MEERVPAGVYGNGANRAGKEQWSSTGGKKGGKGRWQRRHQNVLELWEHMTHCGKLHPRELEQESECCRRRQKEASVMNCLEESENEQWQEVISKKPKWKLKKLAHESLLSVENNSFASPRKVIDDKDTRVNTRATMDTGAAGPDRDVPASDETGSHERNEEICHSNWRKDQRPGAHTISFKSVEVYRGA